MLTAKKISLPSIFSHVVVPRACQASRASSNRRYLVTDTSYDSHFRYTEHFDGIMNAKRNDNTYRVFRNINRFSPNRPFAYDGTANEVNVWCSNDSFGLGHHPEVRERIHSVLDQYGATAGGGRNGCGSNILVSSLEQALANHHQKAAALLYGGGFVANDSGLVVLGTRLPGCVFVSDQDSHASMIDGMRHSRANKVIWKHNDPVDLEAKLASLPKDIPKIICFESVYSMTGTIAPIAEICALARKYGALTFCDEGHAVGFYGPAAAGIVSQLGLEHEVDIISAGLGKALGTIGGYIAGPESLVDTLRSFSRGMIFTSVTPPPYVAGAEKSMDIISRDVELRKQYHRIVASVKRKLVDNNLPLLPNQTHLLPLLVGGAKEAAEAANLLYDEYQIYIPNIHSPSVPMGAARLRIQPSIEHTEKHITKLISALVEVWRRLGLKMLNDWKYASNGEVREEWSLGKHEPPIWTARLAGQTYADDQALDSLFTGKAH